MPSGRRYYCCRGKQPSLTSYRENRCPSRFAPSEQLECLVWDDVCRLLTHPEAIRLALERAHGGHWLPRDLQARRDALRRGQVGVGQQVERLTEAYLAGVVGLQEYQRRRRESECRAQALDAQCRQLEAQLDRRGEITRIGLSMDEFCQRVRDGLEQATWERKRQLIETLVARVIVTDGEVEIRYVIPIGPAGQAAPACHLRSDYLAADAVAFGQHAGRLVRAGDLGADGRGGAGVRVDLQHGSPPSRCTSAEALKAVGMVYNG